VRDRHRRFVLEPHRLLEQHAAVALGGKAAHLDVGAGDQGRLAGRGQRDGAGGVGQPEAAAGGAHHAAQADAMRGSRRPAVGQRLHRQERDVRRDRGGAADDDLTCRRDQQARPAGPPVGVVIGHQDAAHRRARIEVLRGIRPADLAHADVQIRAVQAQSQSQPAARVDHRAADDARRLDEPVLVAAFGDVVAADLDGRGRHPRRQDAQCVAEDDRGGPAHRRAAGQLDDVADADHRVEADAIDPDAAGPVLDPRLIERRVGKGDRAGQLDVDGRRQRRRQVADRPDRGHGAGLCLLDDPTAACESERQRQRDTRRRYTAKRQANAAFHGYSIGTPLHSLHSCPVSPGRPCRTAQDHAAMARPRELPSAANACAARSRETNAHQRQRCSVAAAQPAGRWRDQGDWITLGRPSLIRGET
jgi:hypothetical protein